MPSINNFRFDEGYRKRSISNPNLKRESKNQRFNALRLETEKENMMEKKVFAWEPWFFIAFGLFHLHRIWGLIDRSSYAKFWIDVLENKGVTYFALMGLLAVLCILGVTTFVKNYARNYWWRWIYLFGGVYLLFDLFAIAIGLEFWNKLILWMFDVTSIYWNIVWSFFILLGGFVFALGIKLLIQR